MWRFGEAFDPGGGRLERMGTPKALLAVGHDDLLESALQQARDAAVSTWWWCLVPRRSI